MRSPAHLLPQIAASLLALLLVVATFTAGKVRAQTERTPDDAAISRQVERAIAGDPVLKRMQIRVDTRRGIVALTGFVRSIGDIARAGELAHAVSGVTGVNNQLQVANRPSRA